MQTAYSFISQKYFLEHLLTVTSTSQPSVCTKHKTNAQRTIPTLPNRPHATTFLNIIDMSNSPNSHGGEVQGSLSASGVESRYKYRSHYRRLMTLPANIDRTLFCTRYYQRLIYMLMKRKYCSCFQSGNCCAMKYSLLAHLCCQFQLWLVDGTMACFLAKQCLLIVKSQRCSILFFFHFISLF